MAIGLHNVAGTGQGRRPWISRLVEVLFCALLMLLGVVKLEAADTQRAYSLAPIATVTLPSEGQNRFLQLDRGTISATRPTNAPVAYLTNDSKAGWMLTIENIYNYGTQAADGERQWTMMSADAIAQPAGLAAVPFERNGFYSLKTLPSVILIPQWGLLRIVSFNNTKRSVSLEMRRVIEAQAK